MGNSAFSQQNINGVFIPSALLLVGVAIVKAEWLPYAAVFAALVGGVKVFTSSNPDVVAPAKSAVNAVSNAVSNSAPRGAANKSEAGLEGAEENDPDLLKVIHPKLFREFPVTEIKKTSHNVAIYRFGLPKPDDVLGLPIGQHISLAATPKGAEAEVVRSYTPISADEEDKGYFDLLIKAYPQGNISAHMATLKVGDTMKVRGPKGAMVYTPNMCRHIGMIAGGTGITPMLQVIKAVIRYRPRNGGQDTTQVDLIFANVNPDDILLKEELDQLAREDDKFNVYYVLNNPPEGWKGGVGFVTPEMISQHMPKPAKDIKVLLCGPPPMVSAMKKATESLGYDKARPVSKLVDQVFAF